MSNIIEIFEDIVVDESYDSDYTLEDAAMLIADAKARGWDVPDKLTPELYLKLYHTHKKPRSKEYLMAICKYTAEDCLMDGIDTVEDAQRYLTDLKLNGYPVPAMLTPELFLQLYKEYE